MPLYVSNLGPHVTESILHEAFSAIGPLLMVRVCRDFDTIKPLGYAYVTYHSDEHGMPTFLQTNRTNNSGNCENGALHCSVLLALFSRN